jgi:hypothetical protein
VRSLSVEKNVTLAETDWRTLLNFAGRMAQEIGEYDDEDEEYVAVRDVLTGIERQLDAALPADTPHVVPTAPRPAG